MSALPVLAERLPAVSDETDRVTIREIAAALTLSKSQAERKATLLGWRYSEEIIRGGRRRLYLVSALPPDVRDRILARRLREAAPAISAPVASAPSGRSARQTRTMEARAALLAEVDRQSELCGVSWNKAAAIVAEAARAGALSEALTRLIAAANARPVEGGRTLSHTSLRRWDRDRRNNGVAALAPLDTNPVASEPPVWFGTFLDIYRGPQKRSVPACLEDLPAALAAKGITLIPGQAKPTPSTVRYWLNKIDPQTRNKGRMGPRALLAMRAYKHRDTSGLSPMDIVAADGHTFRAKVSHPTHGQPFQPEVMVVIDVVTRLAVGWSAGLAESAQVTMDGLRNAVENFGLPEILHTDNGSGFCNDATSDELLGFYARLGVTHMRSEPGRAQARGLIERRQATLWRRSARKLPTYVGRDMDREAGMRIAKLVEKDIKDKGASRLLMSWAEFLVWAQGEIDAYNARPQRCLPKIRDPETGVPRHMSPAEALAAWREKGWEPVSLAPDEIDDLFRPQESRTTTRGEVRLPWGTYYHRALEQFDGDKVRVGYDIHDGSKVWVRTLKDGRLICVATRDGNAVPYAPSTMLEHAQAQRAAGKVRRLEDKLALAQAESGPRQIEAEPAVDLTPEQRERANAEYLRLVAPAEPAVAPIATAPETRPTFGDDAAWAEWLLDHPTLADDRDRALIRDALRNGGTRALLTLRGIDTTALAALARPTPTHQDGKTTCALAM